LWKFSVLTWALALYNSFYLDKVGVAKEGREKIKFSAVCPTAEEVDDQDTYQNIPTKNIHTKIYQDKQKKIPNNTWYILGPNLHYFSIFFQKFCIVFLSQIMVISGTNKVKPIER
jgi:hypothetical protein